MINKVKSPPIRQDKSMPPHASQAALQKWKKIEVEYGEFTDFFSLSLSKSSFAQSFLPIIEIPRYEELTVFQNC